MFWLNLSLMIFVALVIFYAGYIVGFFMCSGSVKEILTKIDSKHQHKCPDCGVEFDCPCGEGCKIEYDKYPCIKHIMNHCIEFTTKL